jgi:hypothetical protein
MSALPECTHLTTLFGVRRRVARPRMQPIPCRDPSCFPVALASKPQTRDHDQEESTILVDEEPEACNVTGLRERVDWHSELPTANSASNLKAACRRRRGEQSQNLMPGATDATTASPMPYIILLQMAPAAGRRSILEEDTGAARDSMCRADVTRPETSETGRGISSRPTCRL